MLGRLVLRALGTAECIRTLGSCRQLGTAAGSVAVQSAQSEAQAQAQAQVQSATATATAADKRINLVGLRRAELRKVLEEKGVEGFRANIVWHWLYLHGATAFPQMRTLSKKVVAVLEDNFRIDFGDVSTHQKSDDGTAKLLVNFPRAKGEIETVYIPDRKRGTVCVSSQVGCSLNCSFCHTGTQKFMRNLTAPEIVSQVMLVRKEVGDVYTPASSVKYSREEDDENPDIPRRLVTHIVLMGQGEPLMNYKEVSKAIEIISDPEGIAISKRRITLSTSGIVPLIPVVGSELNVNLAISLHATTDEMRNELVPINKQYGLTELMNACRAFPTAKNSRSITFEYVMLDGVNDTLQDAKRLVKLLHQIPSNVNLIPFNPWPGSPYSCSPMERIIDFQNILLRADIRTTIRFPRGRDIMAACGQLKSSQDSKRKAVLGASPEGMSLDSKESTSTFPA